MHNRKAEYDIAARADGIRPRAGKSPRPDSAPGHVGRIAGFRIAQRMTTRPRPHRVPHRWAFLAAFTLFVGQTVADTHVHLDEHEEELCTVCAISEPGHVPEVGRVDAQPSQWHRSDSLPMYSATVSPRPYEVARPRAPPVSVS